MQRLLDVMRTLRAPGGCPWDREQTHASLRPYLLEEAAEAVEALTGGDRRAVIDELGDVLLQIAFHAVIAEEENHFGYPDIETAIVDKLVRRHPHVFGDAQADDAAQVLVNWQAIKEAERGDAAAGGRVPARLPSLMRAAALDEALGWSPDEGVAGAALVDAARSAEALGAALLTLVQLARRAGIDAEMALRDSLAARQARDP